MQERTRGPYSLLSRPGAYSRFQDLLGGGRARSRFVGSHLRPRPGDRILDIGCGTGEILEHLPEVDYLGIDLNPDYVEAARRRYGDRAQFVAGDVREVDLQDRRFDLVSVVALLHHLDDDGVRAVFALASRTLDDSGRMITLDNAYTDGQSRLARWVIAADRGACVRTPAQYEELARPYFGRVRPVVRTDLLRIPYTHAILECAFPRRSGP